MTHPMEQIALSAAAPSLSYHLTAQAMERIVLKATMTPAIADAPSVPFADELQLAQVALGYELARVVSIRSLPALARACRHWPALAGTGPRLPALARLGASVCIGRPFAHL